MNEKMTAKEIKQAMYDMGFSYFTDYVVPEWRNRFVKQYYDNADGETIKLDKPIIKTFKQAREYLES